MIPVTAPEDYVGFVAFTILIWDHIDTFPAEVEYIWNGKKGPIVYLFLLNRYLTPLGFIVNLFAYLSPVWTIEGSMTVIGIHVVGMMMFLRIHALYWTNRIVVAGVFSLLLVSVGMSAWLLAHGQPCTMIFPPSLSVIASSSAWLPLLYDSVVVVLTVMKALPLPRINSGTHVMKRLLEDGLKYYAAIFSVNLVLAIMIIAAPLGLKNIAAHITVTMMSRITLNLKKCAKERLENTILRDPGSGLVFRSPSVSLPAQVHTRNRYQLPDW
ncbi:hypothetical protein DFH06DRAFT_1246227 [Mycena polygramma]|nr:hypothetical protein DFH06DRAFT_1246227 [Mycena polygramma]